MLINPKKAHHYDESFSHFILPKRIREHRREEIDNPSVLNMKEFHQYLSDRKFLKKCTNLFTLYMNYGILYEQ